MMEAELKFHAPDLEGLERALVGMGASPVSEAVESDTYYRHPCRDLAASDEALRIRTWSAGDGVERNYITYKGPRVSSATGKSRIERECPIGDPREIEAILLALGFRQAGRVRKTRKTYSHQEIHICLDHVEGLGGFAELEIRVEEDELAPAVERLRALASRLGLRDDIRISYLEMLLEGNGDTRS